MAETEESSEPERLSLAVFASGSGSNFQAILDAIQHDGLPARVALCVSNRPEAGVLKKAESSGVATAVLNPAQFRTEAEYCEKLLRTLEENGVNFIALAGYLRIIPSAIVRAFHGRMLNIHPALLPAFGGKGMYGRRIHEAVIESGAHWTGVTVHLVDETYDTGPIVLQKPVPVEPDDTADDLAARVLRTEHLLYPRALRLFAEGRVTVHGRRTFIAPASHSIQRTS